MGDHTGSLSRNMDYKLLVIFSKRELLRPAKLNDLMRKEDIVKNYVYRMTHDTGFAPNVRYSICTLSGCKKTTIEVWAQKGSWVIGIGGNGTGNPDRLIYAMKVEENSQCSRFKKKYPCKSKYLRAERAGTNVLTSRKFYYFGDRAVDVPRELRHIVIDRQGCKRVSDEDVSKLEKHLRTLGYGYGKFGSPNNG